MGSQVGGGCAGGRRDGRAGGGMAGRVAGGHVCLFFRVPLLASAPVTAPYSIVPLLLKCSVGSGPTCHLAAATPSLAGVVLHAPFLSGDHNIWLHFYLLSALAVCIGSLNCTLCSCWRHAHMLLVLQLRSSAADAVGQRPAPSFANFIAGTRERNLGWPRWPSAPNSQCCWLFLLLILLPPSQACGC